MALVVKNLLANLGDIRDSGLHPGWGRHPGEGMVTHSTIPAWRIPWTEEPHGLHFIGSERVGHNLSDLAHMLSMESNGKPLVYFKGKNTLLGGDLWIRGKQEKMEWQLGVSTKSVGAAVQNWGGSTGAGQEWIDSGAVKRKWMW